ncbi:hypothetical protein Tco_0217687 [Tanacetum coccineum]
MRVQNDAINQTDQSNCQLMIGSISVTVRNSSGKQKVDNLAEVQDTCNTDLSNCSTVELRVPQQDTTYQLEESSSWEAEKEADETMPTASYNDSCELNGNNSEGTNASHLQMKDKSNQEGMPFSVPATKAFLAESRYTLLRIIYLYFFQLELEKWAGWVGQVTDQDWVWSKQVILLVKFGHVDPKNFWARLKIL